MDLKREKELKKEGYETVLGTDEAGRGPIAGPVTAAAVRVDVRVDLRGHLSRVDDSKRLTEKEREVLYEVLTNHPGVRWSVSWTTPEVIDRINILEATKRAMSRAVERVSKGRGVVVVDGRVPFETNLEQVFVKGGDGLVFSCAAASIIAKVFRDRTMRRYHQRWPVYGFNEHKGYATRQHRRVLLKQGPTRIHRRSFAPLRNLDF